VDGTNRISRRECAEFRRESKWRLRRLPLDCLARMHLRDFINETLLESKTSIYLG